jgi:hypothetical protein
LTFGVLGSSRGEADPRLGEFGFGEGGAIGAARVEPEMAREAKTKPVAEGILMGMNRLKGVGLKLGVPDSVKQVNKVKAGRK